MLVLFYLKLCNAKVIGESNRFSMYENDFFKALASYLVAKSSKKSSLTKYKATFHLSGNIVYAVLKFFKYCRYPIIIIISRLPISSKIIFNGRT